MALLAKAVAADHQLLDESTIRETLQAGLGGQFQKARVLVLIPDHTRTMPLPQLFRLMVNTLHDVSQLDFMVALGTHPPLTHEQLLHLVGISYEESQKEYAHVGLLNHIWNDPELLLQLGVLPLEQIQTIAGDNWHPSLGGDVPVQINQLAMTYDQIIILGPTFPHEVVGFSGGAKYLFPGISGPEMINVTHWLGALITILDTIGIENTPMREMIHAAAAMVRVPITLVSVVVEKEGLAGMFIGDMQTAFHEAVQLSSALQITWVDEPFQQVLSFAPPMYDELWTAAKAMYKLEPAIADGGEVIVYAPHLEKVSDVHGKYLHRIGYHVRDYFLKQWEQFQDVPLGVLAHSTHLKGSGTFENGIENPRITVTLASKMSREDCERLNLGYLDYRTINPADWQGREGVLYVPKAGEMLYRLKAR